MVLVEDGEAFLEDYAAHTVLAEHFRRAPAREYLDSVLACLGALLRGCRHYILTFKRKHLHRFGSATHSHSCRVYGHVASADHDHLALQPELAAVGFVEEFDGGGGAFEPVALYARQTSALTAYGHVEALVALGTQFIEAYILADLDSGAYFDTDFAHYVDFGFDDFLFEFI